MKWAIFFLLGLPIAAHAGSITITPAATASAPSSDPLDPSYYPGIPASTAPSWVWVADASTKVFQASGAPSSVQVSTPSAARNERVYWQLCMQAPAGGLSNVQANMSNLTNAQSSFFISSETVNAANNFEVAFESVTVISTPTASGGASYYGSLMGNSIWKSAIPDHLIAKIDPYYHQTTNAFPFSVTAGNNQCLMFDVLVPTGAPSGYYSFSTWLSSGASNSTFATINGVLEVWDWIMPSTMSLLAYNSGNYADLCVPQYGGPTNTGCQAYNPGLCGASGDTCAEVIAHDECTMLLDHRDQCGAINNNGYTISQVQTYFSNLLTGTTSSTYLNTLLPGARLNTAEWQLQGHNKASAASWVTVFNSSGENISNMTPFNYACDEPSIANLSGPCVSSMTSLSGSGITNLVTANYKTALSAGATALINIAVPIIEDLAQSATNYPITYVGQSSFTLGSYADCESSNDQLGDGLGSCNGPTGSNLVGNGTGLPAPHIDALPMANLALSWLLFFDSATLDLNSTFSYCWLNDCGSLAAPNVYGVNGMYYKGNGDETLLYPGTTLAIGVSTPTLDMSLREMYREIGHEDYEKLHYLVQVGKSAQAWSAVNEWVSSEANFNENPYLPGSFTGNYEDARQKLGHDIHAIAHPGSAGGVW